MNPEVSVADRLLENLLQKLPLFSSTGEPISLEELCKDAPELLPRIRERKSEHEKNVSEGQLETCSILRDDTSPQTKFLIVDPDATIQRAVPNWQSGRMDCDASRHRFKIERKHREGGLGVVHYAEDTELRRSVALKQIKPAKADDPEKRARFVREAEITGSLEHPGVVPIYSLGADDDGRPFYAMRFIQGKSLSDAIKEFHDNKSRTADERTLDFRKLLTRFIGVCQTLAYAHSKNILHRDLKPDNIMLGEFGETLVVDWGLAKRLQDTESPQDSDPHKAVDEAGLSSDGDVMGTPNYMSPEQAEGAVAAITASSDIYSLGATLYTLLTNSTPYRGKTSLEVVARVRRGDFATPRSVDATIPRPLDAICVKAMSKSPSDRYLSASALADDLEKYLADEPGTAYRESINERARRWMRKHPALVMSAAVSVVLVLLSVSVFGAYAKFKNGELEKKNSDLFIAKENAKRAETVATLAKDKAETNLKYATSANDILGSVFKGIEPSKNYSSVAEFQDVLKKNLAGAVKSLEHSAIGDPLVVAKIQLQLGLSLWGLGDFESATSVLVSSRDAREKLLGKENLETLESAAGLANVYASAGKYELALPMLEETLKLRRSKLGESDPDTLVTMNDLAAAYKFDGKIDLAIALFEETLQAMQVELGQEHPHVLTCLHNLAECYEDIGDVEKAMVYHQRALAIQEVELGADHEDTLTSKASIANLYSSMGRLDLAVPLYESTLKTMRSKLGDDHPITLFTMNNLANTYRKTQQVEKAVTLQETAFERLSELLGPSHPETLLCMSSLARTYGAAGKFELAIPLLEEALALMKSRFGQDHATYLSNKSNLAQIFAAAGQVDKAADLYEKTIEQMKASMGPDHPDTLTSMVNLAGIYGRTGKSEQAIALLEGAVALVRSKNGNEHPQTLAFLGNLATAYRSAGKVEQAIKLNEETLRVAEVALGPDHPESLRITNNLAADHVANRRLDLAIPLLEKAVKAIIAKNGVNHPTSQQMMLNLANVYQRAENARMAFPLLEKVTEFQQSEFGPTHVKTIASKTDLAEAYAAASETQKAVDLWRDLIRLHRQLLGDGTPESASKVAAICRSMLDAKEFDTSEKYLRECLTVRESTAPEAWTTFNTKSMLGAALAGQKKLAEAETYLLSGFEGMERSKEAIPASSKLRLTEAAQRLVDLYKALEKPEETATWQAKFEGLNREFPLPQPPKTTPSPPTNTNTTPSPPAETQLPPTTDPTK